MKNKKWTEEDNSFLKENYEKEGTLYCSKKLERSRRAVKNQVQKLGLKMTFETRSNLMLKHSKEDIINAVKNSISYSDALRNLGIQAIAGNFSTIKRYIKRYNIDISHFLNKKEMYKYIKEKGGFVNSQKKPIEYFLVSERIVPSNFKERLYKEGLKERKCELCGQGEMWNGKKMSLILDHINGIHNDNRIENLRIVCPNCDATLDTHCYKNVKRKIKEKNTLNIKKERKRKVERPSLEQLREELKIMSFCAVGRKYGVSDNAIRKWIKQYEKEIKI